MAKAKRKSTSSKRRRKGKASASGGGSLYSLENAYWMHARKAADAIMHSVMSKEFDRLGIAQEVTPTGIQISAYTREHVLAHSSGLKSVIAELKESFGINDPSNASAAQKQAANLKRRCIKREHLTEILVPMWRARNKAHGLPTFNPGDKRLAKGFEIKQAISADAAIEKAFELKQAGEARLLNEHDLLEHAMRASEYRLDHEALISRIDELTRSGELLQLETGLVKSSAHAPTYTAEQVLSQDGALKLLDRLTHERGVALPSEQQAQAIVALTSSRGSASLCGISQHQAAVLIELLSDEAPTVLTPAAGVSGRRNSQTVDLFLTNKVRGGLVFLADADRLTTRESIELQQHCEKTGSKLIYLFAADTAPSHAPSTPVPFVLPKQSQPNLELKRPIRLERVDVIQSDRSTHQPAMEAADRFYSSTKARKFLATIERTDGSKSSMLVRDTESAGKLKTLMGSFSHRKRTVDLER